MKERRTLDTIYVCFLEAVMLNKGVTIYHESHNGLTAIQLVCKLSYDKAKKHRNNLIKWGLLTDKPLQVTELGIEFCKEMSIIEDDRKLIDTSYLTEDREIPNIKLVGIQTITPVAIIQNKYNHKMTNYSQIHKINAEIIEILENQN